MLVGDIYGGLELLPLNNREKAGKELRRMPGNGKLQRAEVVEDATLNVEGKQNV